MLLTEDSQHDEEPVPDQPVAPATATQNPRKPKTGKSEEPPVEAEIPPEVIHAIEADNLRNSTAAVNLYIAASSSIAPRISTDAFHLYRAQLLREAGNPTDPIEVMMLEQIALAHFHIGRLHLKSCATEHGPLSIAFSDAATRLTAEFRRSALALEDYRSKQIARKTPATGDSTEKAEAVVPETPAAVPAKPLRPRAKKKTAASEVAATKKTAEIPEWLRKRTCPSPSESLLATSAN